MPVSMIPMEVHHKVWGYEEWLDNNPEYCCKKLHVYRGGRCSYHMHKVKLESFHVLEGVLTLTIGQKDSSQKVLLNVGDTIRIPRGVYHSFLGLRKKNVIVEVSTHHEDDDSYRLVNSSLISPRNKSDREQNEYIFNLHPY